jgi:hypothetical protein
MSEIKNLIHVFAWLAVGFSLASAYLKLNKLWKRKHQAEVAQSVSITGNFLDVLPLSLLGANYLIVAQWQGFLDSLIWIIAGVMMMLIGVGYWVPGERKKNLWHLVRESLTIERQEVGTLARSMFYPSNADLIIKILSALAVVDNHLDETEEKFIENFADNWGIDIDWAKVRTNASAESAQRILEMRQLTEEYLATSPPSGQVSQLGDIVDALVRIDRSISPEEEIVLAELNGLIVSYVTAEGDQDTYTVTVVPQSPEQVAAIDGQLPNLRKMQIAGGVGYLVNSYFSRNYAELICRQYRDLGFFTVTVEKHLIPATESAAYHMA